MLKVHFETCSNMCWQSYLVGLAYKAGLKCEARLLEIYQNFMEVDTPAEVTIGSHLEFVF